MLTKARFFQASVRARATHHNSSKCCNARFNSNILSPLARPEVPKLNGQHTRLKKIIQDSIKASGPITVSQYIQLCLSHPTEGYYMKGDVFGQKGDFTTSPEISQVFGELLAVWFVSHWLNHGKGAKVKVVELGPGRGTLMDDMLRTFAAYKRSGIEVSSVHLIETSENLRKIQAEKLSSHNVPITWYDQIEDVKQDETYTVVVAHEFFDALPVTVLENTPQGYREVFVDLKDASEASRTPTSSLVGDQDFRFALSPTTTPASTILSASSPRFNQKPVGSRLEVSPSSWSIAKTIGELVTKSSGGSGLIIDYGDDHSFGNSLRAFRKHEHVDVFSEPGHTDLTTNVDFAYLKEALQKTAASYGPITQKDFLVGMGIEHRMDALLKAAVEPSRKEAITSSVARLIDPASMGKEYKVLAVTPRLDETSNVYPFTGPNP